MMALWAWLNASLLEISKKIDQFQAEEENNKVIMYSQRTVLLLYLLRFVSAWMRRHHIKTDELLDFNVDLSTEVGRYCFTEGLIQACHLFQTIGLGVSSIKDYEGLGDS